jgi:hypothetical protein
MSGGGPVLHPKHEWTEWVEAHRTRDVINRSLWSSEIDIHPPAEVPRCSQIRIECQCAINQRGTIVKVAGDASECEPTCVQSNGILFANRTARRARRSVSAISWVSSATQASGCC